MGFSEALVIFHPINDELEKDKIEKKREKQNYQSFGKPQRIIFSILIFFSAKRGENFDNLLFKNDTRAWTPNRGLILKFSSIPSDFTLREEDLGILQIKRKEKK